MADTYIITQKSTVHKDTLIKQTEYYLSGQRKHEYSLINQYYKGKLKSQKYLGTDLEWFENGKLNLKSFYQDGLLEGEFCTY